MCYIVLLRTSIAPRTRTTSKTLPENIPGIFRFFWYFTNSSGKYSGNPLGIFRNPVVFTTTFFYCTRVSNFKPSHIANRGNRIVDRSLRPKKNSSDCACRLQGQGPLIAIAPCSTASSHLPSTHLNTHVQMHLDSNIIPLRCSPSVFAAFCRQQFLVKS